MLFGTTEIADSVGDIESGLTVSVALGDCPPQLAQMVTILWDPTLLDLMLKVAEVACS